MYPKFRMGEQVGYYMTLRNNKQVFITGIITGYDISDKGCPYIIVSSKNIISKFGGKSLNELKHLG